LAPGYEVRDEKNPDPRSGINIPDQIFASLGIILWFKNIRVVYPGSKNLQNFRGIQGFE
jgi:hypothetical protein